MAQNPDSYASPPDDGGDQGAHTVPSDTLAQQNTSSADDRQATAAWWLHRTDKDTVDRPAGGWRVGMRSTLFTVAMVVAFGGIAVAGAYCNGP